jgi:hypothetical protein
VSKDDCYDVALGGQVNKKSMAVRIIAVPPGEAPLWVREKWVGLTLPTYFSSPKTSLTIGVVSGPRTRLGQLWAILRGRAARTSGYAVDGNRAVEILASSSPEAAAWWREHAAELVAPKRRLVFPAEACQVVEM